MFGEGGGLSVLSILGVPIRLGLEKSFILDDSFFALSGRAEAGGGGGDGCIACGEVIAVPGRGGEDDSLPKGKATLAAAFAADDMTEDMLSGGVVDCEGSVAERFRCEA